MSRAKEQRIGKRQKGLVLVLVTVAMLSVIGMAAFSIDVNHALMSKNRLQNGVDAAALAAAVVIDDGRKTDEATTAAMSTLTNIANASGNAQMSFSTDQVLVQFSNDPESFPLPPGTGVGSVDTEEDTFVRVIVSNYELSSFLSQALDIYAKPISASAVAGPSPSALSNVVPMAVCQDTEATGSNGYDVGKLYALKLAEQNQDTMGSGNYQLLDFGSGADTVRDALAGGYEGRAGVGDIVQTKPGNTIGPVGQGLNTRFGDYGGAGLTETEFPPDVYVKEPPYKAQLDNDGNIVYEDKFGNEDVWNHDSYLDELALCNGGSDCPVNGEHGRRVLIVPIVDCSGASGGTNSFEITALGCFFMLQKAPTSSSGKQAVFGEFLYDCSSTGGTPDQSSNSNGPYIIVLYKDPDGGSS